MKKKFHALNTTPLHLGSLTRQQALFCLKIWSFTQDALSNKIKNKHYLLAVSGGVDSIALLLIFIALREKYELKLSVAHFNHSIRQASDEEQIFVENLCKRFNVPFYSDKEDIQSFATTQHLGLEEAGRLRRYVFFEKCRKKCKADYICTAHHGNDLGEDVIMRLIRGTTWPALGGMMPYDTTRKLLRPFLHSPKKELTAFVEQLGFSWCEDKSNSDTIYLRNRIRKNLMPILYEENTNFLEKITNLNTCAMREKAQYHKQIKKFWKHIKDKNRQIHIPLLPLNKTDEALRFHIYIHALDVLGAGHPQNKTLEKMNKAVIQNNGKTIFQFSHNARAKIENNFLIFYIQTQLSP